ncbi:hypothetical protein [Micromonospora sp. NPDC126480]|uniref:hypothetical protein n=1 Tax=Micromonospora sp. NPDC126480 TaxID=3155312 RepID=UPI003325CDDA
MHDDASPFFIAPHRFDAVDDTGPVLDRRHELVPEPGERLLGRHRVRVAGYLLGPSDAWRSWELPALVSVTVTDRRLAYVGSGSQLSVVGGTDEPRHRRGVRLPGLVSGQIRWQWPSRLEVVPPGPGRPGQVLVVCDALRTIHQPALALAHPDGVVHLARQIRRAVAAFRLTHPELVDLSPPERDVLALRAAGGPLTADGRVTLPGSLPVEFRSRDDYYRPDGSDRAWPGPAADAASGHR